MEVDDSDNERRMYFIRSASCACRESGGQTGRLCGHLLPPHDGIPRITRRGMLLLLNMVKALPFQESRKPQRSVRSYRRGRSHINTLDPVLAYGSVLISMSISKPLMEDVPHRATSVLRERAHHTFLCLHGTSRSQNRATDFQQDKPEIETDDGHVPDSYRTPNHSCSGHSETLTAGL